jgi:hypothetical protein
MSVMRRFPGWSVEPRFAGGAVEPVAISLDEQFLTEWRGDPAQLWRIPFSELRDLEIVVARRLRLRATVAGVRYTWTTRRSGEHDELIDEVQMLGGRVVRPHRVVTGIAASVAVVLIAATAATIITRAATRTANPATAAEVGQLRATDVPAGWRSVIGAPLDDLDGQPGQALTESEAGAALTGTFKQIEETVAANYQRCMGVSAASDRLFGAAGVVPAYEVTGPVYATSAFGRAEIGTVSQYYADEADVRRDVAQYSSPRFGRCLVAANGQMLLASSERTPAAARTVLLGTGYSPRILPSGWARGGAVAIELPNGGGTVTLASVLLAAGHEEVEVNMIVGDWPAARGVVAASAAAILGRLAGPKTTTAA